MVRRFQSTPRQEPHDLRLFWRADYGESPDYDRVSISEGAGAAFQLKGAPQPSGHTVDGVLIEAAAGCLRNMANKEPPQSQSADHVCPPCSSSGTVS